MCVFTVWSRRVAAAILAAVEGGILPPGRRHQIAGVFPDDTPFPPGRMPGSTAGKMPAATVSTHGRLRPRVLSVYGVLRGRYPSPSLLAHFLERNLGLAVLQTFYSYRTTPLSKLANLVA